MTENRTRATDHNVDDFLNGIADDARRDDCQRLRQLMEDASGEPAVLWGTSIVGFGNLHYRYASGREGDTPAVGFSPRSTSITLYVAGGFEPLGPILERLGSYKLGKGCLYIKRLADVDEVALIDLIDASLDRAAELNVAP